MATWSKSRSRRSGRCATRSGSFNRLPVRPEVSLASCGIRTLMNVAVPRETAFNEARVALVPETVARLVKAGATVTIERGAGTRAAFP
ncbi:MAG: hypothetical protein ACYDEU_03985, partial [Vulcanimicrobiaceae bacterium]